MLHAMASNGDLIPKDYISTMEAFFIYRKTKRGPDSNEQPPQGTKEWKTWYNQQSLEIDADESALLQPFLTGELEALVSKNGEREYRITPGDLDAAKWPSRFFLSSEIFDFHDGPLAKFTGRTPYIHRGQFMTWLNQWFRNYLLDEIANGNLLPDKADLRLAELGLEPLYKEPDIEDFHPEKEIYWSLVMAVAWVSWGDMRSVTKNWENFTQHCRFWRSSKGPGQLREGLVLESSGRPTLLNLMLLESLGNSRPNFPPQLVTIKTAREDLWRKLQAGDLVAVGKQGFGERVPLAAHLWLDLSIQGDGIQRESLGQPGGSTSPTAWHDVKVRCADVMRLWPGKKGLEENSFGAVVASTAVSTALYPSNRPPVKRDAAMRVLSELAAPIVAGKLEALLAEVNSRLDVPISLDTLRRARRAFNKAKG